MKYLKKKAVPALLVGGMLFSSGAMITNTALASTYDSSQELVDSMKG
ncbi:hypothetical protein [Bacillus pretiosus]|uniref:Uncharacterized protein n=1 Tax=Bacillus pretiosus TaxID=2983392 RepID=A0ABT3EPE7_9BACI|nr:hypothetical protein [Bacillus pretiosus]MCW1238486.1 hypothetical protein [Bacillus pretiosus]